MIYCSVNGCYSNDQFGNKRKFYKFPITYERSKLWHKFCCDPTQDRRNRRYICDLHFLDSDYDPNNLHRLRRNAVPSINGPERKLKYPSSTLPKGKFVLDTSLDCVLIVNGANTSQLSKNAGETYKCTRIESNLGDQSQDVSRYFVEHNYSLDFSHSVENPQEHIQSESSDKTSNQSFQNHIHPIKKCFPSNQKHHQPVISTLSSNDQENNEYEGKEKYSGIYKTPCTEFNRNLSNRQLVSAMSSQTDDTDLVANIVEIPSYGDDVATSNVPLTITNVKSLKDTSSTRISHHILSSVSSAIQSSPPLQEEDKLQSSDSLEKPPVCLNPLKNGTIKRKLVKKYKNIKKRYLGFSLNPDDPKYSIATTAQFLGKNNTSFLDPIDNVDLNKGEWYKLYTPSGVSFPKMTESHIGPMVNQLRAKLPILNDRDKLEVSFILSMMSMYPDAPKLIKEQMFQRLSLVFIATMFKWDTAIALAMKDENYPPFIPTGSSNNTALTLEDMVSYVPTLRKDVSTSTVLDNSTEFSKNKSDTISKCYSTKSLKEKNPQKRSVPVKTPHFPFEIIVQGKGSKTKEIYKNLNTITP